MKMSPVLVALVLLAGCGGSNEEPADEGGQAAATATPQEASPGNTISAAAWSKRVEAICAKSAAKSFKAGKQLGRKSAAAGDSKQELTYKVLRLQSKLLDPWMDRLEALPEPEGREEEAKKFIAGMRDIGDLLGETSTAIKDNDQATGKRLVGELRTKTVDARTRAQALDIEKCNPSPDQQPG